MATVREGVLALEGTPVAVPLVAIFSVLDDGAKD